MLRALPTLLGDAGVLGRAREVLAGAPTEVGAAIDELEAVARLAESRASGIEFCFDLAELRGYNYHRGVLFSAYAADHARTVAGGGRYDGVGKAFGRARPATGFDADLKVLAGLGRMEEEKPRSILAPEAGALDAIRQCALWQTVDTLRSEGVRVVSAPSSLAIQETLEWRDGAWVVVPIGS